MYIGISSKAECLCLNYMALGLLWAQMNQLLLS